MSWSIAPCFYISYKYVLTRIRYRSCHRYTGRSVLHPSCCLSACWTCTLRNHRYPAIILRRRYEPPYLQIGTLRIWYSRRAGHQSSFTLMDCLQGPFGIYTGLHLNVSSYNMRSRARFVTSLCQTAPSPYKNQRAQFLVIRFQAGPYTSSAHVPTCYYCRLWPPIMGRNR